MSVIELSPANPPLPPSFHQEDEEEDEAFLFELIDDGDVDEENCISIDCLRSSSSKYLNHLYTINDLSSPRRSIAAREISVDPISVTKTMTTQRGGGGDGDGEGGGGGRIDRNPSTSKAIFAPLARKDSSNYKFPPPLPLPSSKSNKYTSCSLPCSASSSPRSGPPPLIKSSKQWRDQAPPLPPSISHLARQRSATVSPFLIQRQTSTSSSSFARSKSCGEGRLSSPSDEFDIWSKPLSYRQPEKQIHVVYNNNNTSTFEKFGDYGRISSRKLKGKEVRNPFEENFKCGALCLYLPGFGRGKPVKPRKHEQNQDQEQEQEQEFYGKHEVVMAAAATTKHVVSRTVSLEKFECGSWSTSSGLISTDDQVDSARYYDLPLELIQSSINDTDNPVATAFVFDREIKGVLKNSTSRRADQSRISQESSSNRHVRFSTSNPQPSCITPRLRKARDEFNAFLEAQGV